MDFKKFRSKYLVSGWLYLLFLCLLLISLGLLLPDIKLELNLKLTLFILSGICSGIFYGVNNNVVFHHPYDKDYIDKNNNKSIFIKLGIFPGTPELDSTAQLHIFWVHMISGVIGSLSLYLLSVRIPTIDSFIIKDMLGLNFLLLLVAVLGYVGYIPRTLWFFATKGGLGVDRPS